MLSRTLFREIGIPTTLSDVLPSTLLFLPLLSLSPFLYLSASLPRYASLATKLNPSPTSSYNQSSLFPLHRIPA